MKYHLYRSKKSKSRIPNSQLKPHGFTLIEFLVASSLALVVLLAIGITYGITSRMRTNSESRLAAQQDLRNASELILRDAQMAGSFGCFNMGNLVQKQMPASPHSTEGFQSNTANFKLVLEDPAYSGISIMDANTAKNTFNISGFVPSNSSPALIFVYGQNLAPVTEVTNPTAKDAPQELRDVANAGGPIALSSCGRMYIGNGGSLTNNGNDLVIGSGFGGGSIISHFSGPDVFYLPQTTLSQVYGVAYVIGRIPNVNTTADALYRFTLTPSGSWGNPQLMVSNIQAMDIYQLYAGCNNTNTSVTFSSNRTALGNAPDVARISMLPTILEMRLRLNDNANTYGTVNQYLIRANVRGGNVCANQS